MRNMVKAPRLASGLVVATAAIVVAPTASAFDFSVSGQVDRALVVANNGEDTDYGFVDNDGSNTRFRFTGSQKLDSGLKVGFIYEIALLENLSTTYDINNNAEDDFYNNRKADVYVQGGFGKVSFGKGDGAANGSSEVDLSGTAYLGGGSEHYYASGITFLDDDGNELTTIGAGAYNNFDALSRQNRLRYDTPSFGGFVFSASLDNDHAYETALRYSNEFANGIQIEAAVDWLDAQQQGAQVNPSGDRSFDSRFQEYGGSASILLPSGLNFTAMYKNRDRIGDAAVLDANGNPVSGSLGPDAQTYFGGVGYIIGDNHFQVGYGHTDDLANDDSNGNSYQIAYEYDWIQGVELFASYHLLRLDDVDTGTGRVDGQDINYGYVGTRVKFF